MSDQEKKVFDQEVSMDELKSVSGGFDTDCNTLEFRDRQTSGCGHTVEDGSWCAQNDACIAVQTVYMGSDYLRIGVACRKGPK